MQESTKREHVKLVKDYLHGGARKRGAAGKQLQEIVESVAKRLAQKLLPEHAEDLFSLARANFFAGLHEYRGEALLTTLAYSITENAFKNYLQRQGQVPKQLSLESLGEPLVKDKPTELAFRALLESVDKRRLSARLRRILTPTQRRLLSAAIQASPERPSNATLAGKHGLSVQKVKMELHKARLWAGANYGYLLGESSERITSMQKARERLARIAEKKGELDYQEFLSKHLTPREIKAIKEGALIRIETYLKLLAAHELSKRRILR